MSSKIDRKAELQRKKERLAQIRAGKQMKLKQEDEKFAVTVSSSLDQKRKDAEDLLQSVGINVASTIVSQTTEQLPSTKKELQSEAVVETTTYRPRQAKLPKLELSQVWVTSLPPKEVVSYTKETQTIYQQQDSEDEFEVMEEAATEEVLAESIEASKLVDKEDEDEDKQQIDQIIRELTEEEKDVVQSSEGFQHFFFRSSKIVERALSHNIDIFTEYDSQVEETSEVDKSMKLTINRTFSDERWSRRRMVTSLDWSSHHPELCMAAYGNSDESLMDPEGVVLVWNSKYKTTTPEYISSTSLCLLSSSSSSIDAVFIVSHLLLLHVSPNFILTW